MWIRVGSTTTTHRKRYMPYPSLFIFPYLLSPKPPYAAAAEEEEEEEEPAATEHQKDRQIRRSHGMLKQLVPV